MRKHHKRTFNYDPKEKFKTNLSETYEVKKVTDFKASKIDLCYMFFHFQRTSKECGLSVEEIMILIYLYELSFFSVEIDLLRKSKKNIKYLSNSLRGYVKLEPHPTKKIYTLSADGVLFCEKFLESLSQNDGYIGLNRIFEIDSESKNNAVLTKYFNSINKL